MPLATLGALNRGGANPRGLLPQLYLADGCDQSFGDFTPWTEDTCSSLVYTTAVAGEKASHAIKAVKPAMLVRHAMVPSRPTKGLHIPLKS